MVYKLRPLKVSLDFEDHNYKLGDTINIRVELVPNSDVDVRGARIDLICEERFLHSWAHTGPGQIKGTGYHGMAQVTNRKSAERKEKHVHSSVVFLDETRLRSGVPSTHNARLRVQPAPPPHAEEAAALQRDAGSSWSFKWRLVATVDVVRGANPSATRVVQIALPQASASGADARPRMSRPKKPTGPSSGAS